MRPLIRNARLFLSLSLIALCLPGYAADPSGAARIEFVLGSAQVVSASGETRAAVRGMSIRIGDTVISEDARLQLRFGDGSFVALAPGSEFRVNAYSWSGAPDGSERLSMTLVKGGLRTVTGLIGKAMQSAYEMATGVATIGIRGTEYTIVYGNSITGTVAEGRIAVCNGAGCLEVGPGQSYYVRDENTRPAFTDKAAQLPPPAPGRAGNIDSQNLVAGTGLDDSLRLSEFPLLAISTAGGPLSTDSTGGISGGPGGGSGDPGNGGGIPGGGGGIPGGGGGGGNGERGGGPGADLTLGIGFVLIGSTAPDVMDPAQRVSDFLHQNTPGNGNGFGLGNGKGGGPGNGNGPPQ